MKILNKLAKALILIYFLLFFYSNNVLSQINHPNMWDRHHKHIIYNAVKLIEHYRPLVIQNTDLINFLGHSANNWSDWDSDYAGNNPWVSGSLYTGTVREDQEDPIDNICGYFNERYLVTASHFWESTSDIEPVPIPFHENKDNALKKVIKYWYGNMDEGITIGPLYTYQNNQTNPFTIKIVFRNANQNDPYAGLTTVYNDFSKIKVHKYRDGYDACCGDDEEEFINIPDDNIVGYLMTNCHLSEADANIKVKKILFELLGRICHLLSDMSVPAHVHNDMHPVGSYFFDDDPDLYEQYYLNNVFQNKSYLDAISESGSDSAIINLNGLVNPLRSMMYVQNRMADRFASWDFPGNPELRENLGYQDLEFIFHHLESNYNYLNSIGFYTQPLIDAGNTERSEVCNATYNYNYVLNMRLVAGLIYFFLKNTTSPIPEPHIQSASQFPYQIIQGSEGTITVKLDEGLDPYDYYWEIEHINFGQKPYWVSFGLYYNKFRIVYNNPPPKYDQKVPDKWKVKIRVRKNVSSTTFSEIICAPNFDPPPIGGCPWLIVTDKDTNCNFDNNLLNKSQLPENQGNFITDKYILKTKPGIFDNKIKLSIVETSIDSTIINSIKLYAVTHPVGTKLGILSDNTIVMYDSASVIDNTNASLYDPQYNYTNITGDILFHENNSENSNAHGDSLFHIYTEFEKRTINSPAIITFMERDILEPILPHVKDSYTGIMFINNQNGTSQSTFMRRENPDDIIIPVDPESLTGSVDSIHIAWNKGFKINYAAIASLSYSGFTATEWPLVTAFHTSDGDVLQNLLYLDSGYTYINPNAYLNLEFSPPANQGSSTEIKDYILEINGQVIFLGNKKMRIANVSNPNQNNTIPDKYSLSQNYPNPFNPVTKINYSIPKQGFVSLKIYDLLGREIKTIVSETKQPGNYSVDFNGSNLASGVYFYRLESNSFTSIKRMVLIK